MFEFFTNTFVELDVYFLTKLCDEIEAATRGVLYKKVFLEIWQNLQENTCVKVSFLIKFYARKTLSEIIGVKSRRKIRIFLFAFIFMLF